MKYRIAKLVVAISMLSLTAPITKASEIANEDLSSNIRIQLEADDFKDIDYLNGASKNYPTNEIMPYAVGDLIYESYYLNVYSGTSVRLAVVLAEWDHDWFKLEWDGATQSNPKVDLITEDLNTGKQSSLYAQTGRYISTNRGSVEFAPPYTGYYRVWFMSIGSNDVTFYRVAILDS